MSSSDRRSGSVSVHSGASTPSTSRSRTPSTKRRGVPRVGLARLDVAGPAQAEPVAGRVLLVEVGAGRRRHHEPQAPAHGGARELGSRRRPGGRRPVLDDRAARDGRGRDLLPAHDLPAAAAHDARRPPDVARVVAGRGAVRLVAAEVEDRPGDQSGELGDDVAQEAVGHRLGRAERAEADRDARVERPGPAVAGQLGVRGQGGRDVAGPVDLGDDRDGPLAGVAHDPPQVGGRVGAAGRAPDLGAPAVAGQPRPAPDGDAPALVVAEVQVQGVELVEREDVEVALDVAHPEEVAGHVEHRAAVGEPRPVGDAQPRDRPRAGLPRAALDARRGGAGAGSGRRGRGPRRSRRAAAPRARSRAGGSPRRRGPRPPAPATRRRRAASGPAGTTGQREAGGPPQERGQARGDARGRGPALRAHRDPRPRRQPEGAAVLEVQRRRARDQRRGARGASGAGRGAEAEDGDRGDRPRRPWRGSWRARAGAPRARYRRAAGPGTARRSHAGALESAKYAHLKSARPHPDAQRAQAEPQRERVSGVARGPAGHRGLSARGRRWLSQVAGAGRRAGSRPLRPGAGRSWSARSAATTAARTGGRVRSPCAAATRSTSGDGRRAIRRACGAWGRVGRCGSWWLLGGSGWGRVGRSRIAPGARVVGAAGRRPRVDRARSGWCGRPSVRPAGSREPRPGPDRDVARSGAAVG